MIYIENKDSHISGFLKKIVAGHFSLVVVAGWVGYFFLLYFAVFDFFNLFLFSGQGFVGAGHGMTRP